MIKSELVQKVNGQNTHLYQKDVENAVNAVFNKITKALEDGNRMELRGFGTIGVKNRKARVGRNPKTGEKVNIDEKYIPFFKAGKELKAKLNEK